MATAFRACVTLSALPVRLTRRSKPFSGVRSMADKLRHFLHVAGVQGISVAALSEKAGISKTTIYRYANGQGSPTVDAMKLIAKALGCTVREAFPEVYSEKVDVPTVNITDTQPISTAKLAMQYGMTTREFNQALFRAGIQIQRSDGSWVVAGNFADMVTYKPVKTENGTVTVNPKSASKGSTVTITAKPDSGYQLDDLTVTDKNGKELKLTDKGNGKYTFTMPASKVEVNATFVKEVEISPFSDVSTSAYYYEAVKWAQEKGITGGIGNGLFGPNQPCTRAQIVTFLWRAASSPEPKSMSSFSDVSADSYYAKAVAWAVENGITTGTGDGKFSPDATCTRAQSVTFLFRAIGKLVDSKAEFSDVLTDSYYANAVAWAVENGVTNGIGDGLFGPNNSCTRAQIVTFLFRAYQGK